ncbi:MAG: peptidylprolyl isomerase [Hyphomicrobiaceae bacterium]
MKSFFAGLGLAFLLLAQPAFAVPKTDPANTLVIELKTGKVYIELLSKIAPLHVARVKQLARSGFYNGIIFHRVIKGFMAQTGDPTGTGTGGSKLGPLKAEFSSTPFERGTVGAARTQDPNSADSQFFICYTHTPFLNGQYTVWGRVVEGMQYVDEIAKGEPPAKPDKMLRVYILKDGPGKKT